MIDKNAGQIIEKRNTCRKLSKDGAENVIKVHLTYQPKDVTGKT